MVAAAHWAAKGEAGWRRAWERASRTPCDDMRWSLEEIERLRSVAVAFSWRIAAGE